MFTDPFSGETAHGLDDGSGIVAQSTVNVVHAKRLSGIVQLVGRRPNDVPKRRWESVLVFAFFTVAYSWFGYWVVGRPPWSGSETLDRLSRATHGGWHGDPAKPSRSASTTRRSPPCTSRPWRSSATPVTSMAAVPVASAIFA